MKKSLWLLVVIGVLVPTALPAQSDLTTVVSRQVASQQLKQQDPRYERFEQQLVTLRELVGGLKKENSSVVMQSVLELADAFFDYAAENPELKSQEFRFRKGVNIKKIVREIETPMETGWGHTEVMVVSSAIEHFLEGGQCAWKGTQEKDELAVFRQVLVTYSAENVDNNPLIKLLVSGLPYQRVVK